jgi:hypothetical protein
MKVAFDAITELERKFVVYSIFLEEFYCRTEYLFPTAAPLTLSS